MTGASPVTTIQPMCVTAWRSRATPCIVVIGLAPVMPLYHAAHRSLLVLYPNF